MADAVFWQILEAVQTLLRSLTFSAQGSDSVATIEDSAIVIRKLKHGDPDKDERKRDERTPGWIISPGSRISRPPEAGTNIRDDVYYPVLAQLIDKDNFKRENNLQSYLKWLEQAAKVIHSQPMSDVQSAEGIVDIAHAVVTDTVDESMWVKHKQFVGGVEIVAVSREPRGVTS